jgi:hypothetical protein
VSSSSVVDVNEVLVRLAAERPVFHSEADFQFAFAWRAKVLRPSLDVRLETHPEPNVRLDIHFRDPATNHHQAIELKYMTRLWSGTCSGEEFQLKNHGANDLRCYDVVKDIARVERFIGGRAAWSGCVVALTNEPAYWRPPTHGRLTNADAFRLHDGVQLKGARGWGPNTGGTSRGREAAIDLRGEYRMQWQDYSRLDGTVAGTFRQLVVPIVGGSR